LDSARQRLAVGVQRWHDSLPGHGWRRANELDLVTQTLALGAQQVLCTAPLLVAMSAIVRRASGRGLGGFVTTLLGLKGLAARDVTALFTSSPTVSTTELSIGLAVAAVFGTGVAATQQRGYEMIWSQPRTGLRSVWRQLGWIAGLLGYLTAMWTLGRLGHSLNRWARVGAPVRGTGQLGLTFLFCWWSQHLLLSGRIRWRALLPGAICMTLATTVLVVVSGIVLPDQITELVSDYGFVGAAFVLSIWLVVLSGAIFGGALLGALIVERRSHPPDPASRTIESTPVASTRSRRHGHP
jgi:membrane protein